MASVENYQAPQVEDYDSEQSEVIRSNFPRKSSPSAQANVSTKRSKDLNAEQAPLLEKMPTNIDLRSDSGYSSYTAASKSSADSAPSATSRSPPVLPASTAPAVSQSPAPPKQRRPTQGDSSRQHSNESSPRQKPKAISRTASVSSKQQRPAAGQRRPTVTRDPRDNKDEECSDPNCTTCPPPSKALPVRRRPELLQTASSRNVPGHPSSETMSQRSDPNPYYSPPSPIYHRQPAPYASQGPAVVQTARTRRPSSATRPRPQSFAGDPSGPYWVPGMPAPYPRSVAPLLPSLPTRACRTCRICSTCRTCNTLNRSRRTWGSRAITLVTLNSMKGRGLRCLHAAHQTMARAVLLPSSRRMTTSTLRDTDSLPPPKNHT
jgi:hypothetical protein